MSILWTLRKWIDPIAFFRDEETARRAREAQPSDLKLDDGDLPPLGDAARPRSRFQCRVCGHHSRDDAYCPKCIAQTMVPVPGSQTIDK